MVAIFRSVGSVSTYALVRSIAALMSFTLAMLYRSNVERVLWPDA
jgi:hypothetical protein